MQRISSALPLTRGIASAREIIAGGEYRSVAGLLNGEVLIGVMYVFLGYALFRWFEAQAKRRGTLEVI
jgi:ABC-2 type transport system permease protein